MNKVTKTLGLFLGLLAVRIVEYFFLKTDRTYLAEHFIHKVIGIVILLLVLRVTHRHISDIGFTKKSRDTWKGFLMGAFFFLISYGIEIMIQTMNQNHPKLMIYTAGFSLDDKVVMNTTLLSFLLVILFNLINVFMEEGVFRGLFIHDLKEPYGFHKANFLVALLFGIWHWPMPFRSYLEGSMELENMLIMMIGYIVMSGIMSIKWGLLYEMTGSLWMGLGDHLFNNLVATNLLHVVTDGGADELMIVRIVVAQLLSFFTVLYVYKVKYAKDKTTFEKKSL
ncbi:CPBP family intramembrane glutamic endopeptidase [Guggenheimella bovis]